MAQAADAAVAPRPLPLRADLLTPYLAVDLDVAEANLRRMQAHFNGCGIALRPHIKTHKLPRFALRQMELGAVGITCQKLSEAEVMVDAGCSDILISYNMLGEARLRRLAALRARCRITTVADSLPVVEGLAWAAALPASGRAGPLPVLVDGDAGGYGRTGVSTPAEACALAEAIAAQPALHFAGLFTYPNLPGTRAWLQEALRALGAAGLDAEVVSSGGTPAAMSAAEIPEVTEYRVGTYIFNDRMMIDRGAATLQDCAATVVAMVMASHPPGRVILDAGSKALAADLVRKQVEDGHGHIVQYPHARIHALSEEHAHCDFGSGPLPRVGELVQVIPNHICPVVNLYDRMALHRAGAVEEIVPVAARGCSQ